MDVEHKKDSTWMYVEMNCIDFYMLTCFSWELEDILRVVVIIV